eukprot:TRINITY_DN5295_c0_g1_i1.p1 TRINITY_DN5295_c0_g1~~TRINITY_DN5295_c0_g1_i1.p1  ORF type:complete len:286 (-),score=20.36 TRINITY_DN5295_c0_g1_i1:876-1613(-)
MNKVKERELFSEIQFKLSPGSAAAFKHNLSVRVVPEIITLGIPPENLSYKQGGDHVTPQQFHQIAAAPSESDLILDCRNFYESRIGKFDNALIPPIRKFSLFPDWVDQNASLLQNKSVYMYCTGGIRCERASAYILSTGVTDKVYQLQGGIHKYIEAFPDPDQSHFKGKNFVFDERQVQVQSGETISHCFFCDNKHDHYRYCTSPDCRVMLLVCPDCESAKQGLAYCCADCQTYGAKWTKYVKTS